MNFIGNTIAILLGKFRPNRESTVYSEHPVSRHPRCSAASPLPTCSGGALIKELRCSQEKNEPTDRSAVISITAQEARPHARIPLKALVVEDNVEDFDLIDIWPQEALGDRMPLDHASSVAAAADLMGRNTYAVIIHELFCHHGARSQ